MIPLYGDYFNGHSYINKNERNTRLFIIKIDMTIFCAINSSLFSGNKILYYSLPGVNVNGFKIQDTCRNITWCTIENEWCFERIVCFRCCFLIMISASVNDQLGNSRITGEQSSGLDTSLYGFICTESSRLEYFWIGFSLEWLFY